MSEDKQSVAYNPIAVYKMAGLVIIVLVCLRIAIGSEEMWIRVGVWFIPATLAGFSLGVRGGLAAGVLMGIFSGVFMVHSLGPPYVVNKVWLLVATCTFLGGIPTVWNNIVGIKERPSSGQSTPLPKKSDPKEIVPALMSVMTAHDPDLRQHSETVASLALAVGRGMQLPQLEMFYLGIAALMHDMGKLGVDQTILKKTTSLSSQEREIIRQHPQMAEQILKSVTMFKAIIPSIKAHHERWDGSGYPDRLSGKDIPLYARIIAVCDVYASLVSKRSYRSAWTPNKVMDFMENGSGVLFDPEVLDVFDRTVRPDGEQLPDAHDVVAQVYRLLG